MNIKNLKNIMKEVNHEKCGDAHMKTILATGELGNLSNIARASQICMMAGADFIKTSTGKEPTNATLPVSLVEVAKRENEVIFLEDDYEENYEGFDPNSPESLIGMTLMQEELGRRWLEPDLFRFGASSLLGDIERQLDHFTSGYYSAAYRHPIS